MPLREWTDQNSNLAVVRKSGVRWIDLLTWVVLPHLMSVYLKNCLRACIKLCWRTLILDTYVVRVASGCRAKV